MVVSSVQLGSGGGAGGGSLAGGTAAAGNGGGPGSKKAPQPLTSDICQGTEKKKKNSNWKPGPKSKKGPQRQQRFTNTKRARASRQADKVLPPPPPQVKRKMGNARMMDDGMTGGARKYIKSPPVRRVVTMGLGRQYSTPRTVRRGRKERANDEDEEVSQKKEITKRYRDASKRDKIDCLQEERQGYEYSGAFASRVRIWKCSSLSSKDKNESPRGVKVGKSSVIATILLLVEIHRKSMGAGAKDGMRNGYGRNSLGRGRPE
ncbi:uncharacterized protein H6S33_005841 [Morchella sextelata]|uniref:uncharacterized protein n=1 Tax=Morchella sextelata TaxID=1174677 RepID=UPI001D044391|nr:uncharacterized protein H6S33_005841 [Morchella sextelata]KAH0613955.1 hypothetical protein H6S33_005841 [Morchella sextelata]